MFIILSGAPVAALADNAFPRNVQHALGTTHLERAPKRIVTLGWSGEDVVLSLGQVPVGMTYYSFFPNGMFPWNEQAIGSEKPVLLTDAEINYEAIAALHPDLILAVYSGVDELAYKRLSKIASTVVYRSAPWMASWQEQTSIIGEALGQTETAHKLIDDTLQQLRELGETHPQFASKSFVYGSYFTGGNGIVVYLPSDPRVAAFEALGLQTPTFVQELALQNPNELSVLVSFEELSQLDPDMFIMWFKPGAREALENHKLFMSLRAVKENKYFALEDPVAIWASSALSVRSIPYFFPQFVQRLAEALQTTEHQ